MSDEPAPTSALPTGEAGEAAPVPPAATPDAERLNAFVADFEPEVSWPRRAAERSKDGILATLDWVGGLWLAAGAWFAAYPGALLRSRRVQVAFAVTAFALGIRLWDISLKPLHHDEGVMYHFFEQIHGFAWYAYSSDNYHGPFFYFPTALPTLFTHDLWRIAISAFLVGLAIGWFAWRLALARGASSRSAGYAGLGITALATWIVWAAIAPTPDDTSKFSLRLLPVITGALTATAALWRKSGRALAESIPTALLLAVSPGMLFYQRYTIHEPYFVLAIYLAVLSLVFVVQKPNGRTLNVFAVACASVIALKETWIMVAAAAGVAFASVLLYEFFAGSRTADLKRASREYPDSRLVPAAWRRWVAAPVMIAGWLLLVLAMGTGARDMEARRPVTLMSWREFASGETRERHLADALRSDSPGVRAAAIEPVRGLGTAAAADMLATRMSADSHEGVRSAAAMALANMGETGRRKIRRMAAEALRVDDGVVGAYANDDERFAAWALRQANDEGLTAEQRAADFTWAPATTVPPRHEPMPGITATDRHPWLREAMLLLTLDPDHNAPIGTAPSITRPLFVPVCVAMVGFALVAGAWFIRHAGTGPRHAPRLAHRVLQGISALFVLGGVALLIAKPIGTAEGDTTVLTFNNPKEGKFEVPPPVTNYQTGGDRKVLGAPIPVPAGGALVVLGLFGCWASAWSIGLSSSGSAGARLVAPGTADARGLLLARGVQTLRWLAANRKVTLIALGMFVLWLTTWFSSLFVRWDGVYEFIHGFSKWGARGGEGDGHGKEFLYFFRLLGEFELPLCVLAVTGFVCALVNRERWILFCFLWALVQFLAYSLVRYKTPWCIIGPLLPLIVAAGYPLALVVRAGIRLDRGLQRGGFSGFAGRSTAAALAASVTLIVGADAVLANLAWHSDIRNRYAYVQTDPDAEIMCKVIRDSLLRKNADGTWALTDKDEFGWGVKRGGAGERYRLMGIYAKTWPLPWYFRWIDSQLDANGAPPVYLSYWDPIPTQFGRQRCSPAADRGCGEWIDIGSVSAGADLVCPHCGKASVAKKWRADPEESVLLVSPEMHNAPDSAHALRKYDLMGQFLFLNSGYYYVYRLKSADGLAAERGE